MKLEVGRWRPTWSNGKNALYEILRVSKNIIIIVTITIIMIKIVIELKIVALHSSRPFVMKIISCYGILQYEDTHFETGGHLRSGMWLSW